MNTKIAFTIILFKYTLQKINRQILSYISELLLLLLCINLQIAQEF